MPSIIIAPHVEKARIGIEGIFTVHRENADLKCACPDKLGAGCGGIEVAAIPLLYRKFELLCKASADKFVARMAARDREWTGAPILLHGPWPSRYNSLSDIDSPVWNQAMKRDKTDDLEHAERSLPFVQSLGGDAFTHMDYILFTDFWIRDEYTDLEV